MTDSDYIDNTLNDLPDWIVKSHLCQTQIDNSQCIDRELVSISYSRQYGDFSLTINSSQDLVRIMKTCQYWSVREYPFEVYHCIIVSNSYIDVLNMRQDELPSVQYFESIVDYIVTSQGYDLNQNLLMVAIQTHDIQLLRFCIEYRSMNLTDVENLQIASEAMMLASKLGYLDIIEYLYRYDCPWTACCIRWACKNHHDCVEKFLKDNGCPWKNASLYDIELFQQSFYNVDIEHTGVIECLMELTDIDIDTPDEVR